MTEQQASVFPDLSGIITPEDVSSKGTGSYKADYVNWAKVAHILHQNAPGWQFHLQPAPDGQLVWRSPNGTGFVVGYFTSPQGECTAQFPQAVMDNRNAPVPFDKISARDVTDTHRRALCAAACFTFGLAYELWAKEKIEDPLQAPSPSPSPSAPVGTTSASNKVISDAQLKRLFAIANQCNVVPAKAKEIIGSFGFESSKEVTKDKYEAIVAAIQGAKVNA